MSALLPVLALLLFVGPPAAMIAPALRRPVAVSLALAALLGLVLAVAAGGETATLTVTHAFLAFSGQELAPKDFIVAEASAPGWQWPVLVAVFAASWSLWAWLRPAPPGRPVLTAVAFAWSGSACLLGLQLLAAPEVLAMGLALPSVPPFEIVLLPAMLAASIGLGRAGTGIPTYVLTLSLVIALAHLPLAIFGTLATRMELGTYLDVHAIDFVAHPILRTPAELEAGSTEQLTLLVWLPQLLMWPALTMLSAGGAGFCALMLQRQEASRQA